VRWRLSCWRGTTRLRDPGPPEPHALEAVDSRNDCALNLDARHQLHYVDDHVHDDFTTDDTTADRRNVDDRAGSSAADDKRHDLDDRRDDDGRPVT